MTKQQLKIKILTEKLEKLSGSKVSLQEDIIPSELSNNVPPVQTPMKKVKPQVDLTGAIPIEKLKKGAIFQFPGREREYYFNHLCSFERD